MEYKKGPKGFTLEFNEAEEKNFERFVNDLKSHADFSSLSSNSEFLSLIINEGVASLQQKTGMLMDNLESANVPDFSELMAALLNESMAAMLQFKNGIEYGQIDIPASLDVLLNQIPDVNSLKNEMEQSVEKNENQSRVREP